MYFQISTQPKATAGTPCSLHKVRHGMRGQRRIRLRSYLPVRPLEYNKFLTSVLGIAMSRAEFSPSDDFPPAFSIRYAIGPTSYNTLSFAGAAADAGLTKIPLPLTMICNRGREKRWKHSKVHPGRAQYRPIKGMTFGPNLGAHHEHLGIIDRCVYADHRQALQPLPGSRPAPSPRCSEAGTCCRGRS